MPKVRHTVYLDEARSAVLEALAERLGQPVGVVAAQMLSAMLSDRAPADRAFLLPATGTTMPATASKTPPQLDDVFAATTMPVAGIAMAATGIPRQGGTYSSSCTEESKTEEKSTPPVSGRAKPTVGDDDFEAGWRWYLDQGGRPGPKPKAWKNWNLLLTATGWSGEEARKRWARFCRATEVKCLPMVYRVLNPKEGMLTDDNLRSAETRATKEAAQRAARRRPGDADASEYDHGAAMARVDARRAAPVNYRKLKEAQEAGRAGEGPGAGAELFPCAGGPPAAPQGHATGEHEERGS